MKKLLFLFILVAAAGAGYLYLTGDSRSPEEMWNRAAEQVRDLWPTGLPGGRSAVTEKCITTAGEVIYGEVPEGVRCETVEKVEGALTVVPRDVITSVDAPVHPDPDHPVRRLPKSTLQPVQEPSGKSLTCDSVARCGQFSSCRQARLFANHCRNWNVRDTDRVTCIRRWCEGE